MPIEELIEELNFARGDRYAAIRQELIAIGAPAVPFLVRAYRSEKIAPWICFGIIFEMESTAYLPVLESARDETEEACVIVRTVANYGKPLPEVIPILVDGLWSTNAPKLLSCMNAILHVHPLIEVRHRDRLPQFARAINRLLDLLRHENRYIREESARCLAVLKPLEPDVLPILITALKEKDLSKDFGEAQPLVQAIGAYGRDAVDAIPVFTKILQSPTYHWLKADAARALTRMGDAAAPVIPLLEELRDRTELRFKSETKSFRQAITRIVKDYQKALMAPPPKKVHGDPYLLDLIARMGQQDDSVGCSDNSTSWRAHGEARSLADASLIPKIKELLNGRLSRAEFRKALFILGCVTRNTGSAEGQQLILSLLSREYRRRKDLNAVISAAATCHLKEASPLVRQLFLADNWRHVLDALDFFRETKDDSAIDDIARYIRECPRHGLLGIFALSDIGSPKAVPYLLGVITGNLTGERKVKPEWRHFAIRALGKVKAVEAVPDLIQMLSDRKYAKHQPAIVDALSRIGEKRAFVAVLAVLRETVETTTFAESWSEGHRTLIVNALDFLCRIGKKDDPFVLEVVEMLQSKPVWRRLLKEERQFITLHYAKRE